MKLSAIYGLAGIFIALIAVLGVKHGSFIVVLVPVLLLIAMIAAVISGRRNYGKDSLKGVIIPLLPLAICTVASAFIFKALIGI